MGQVWFARGRLVALATAGTLAGLSVSVMPPAGAATVPAPPAACAPAYATTTPVVTSVTLSTRAIDARTSARQVTITVTAHDTVPMRSAVVSLGVRPYGVPVQVDTPRTLVSAALALTAGTSTAGTWSGRVTIPRWASPGAWDVRGLRVVDAARGFAQLSPFGGAATPYHEVAWPWATAFTVQTSADHSAPTLSSLRTSRARVDTRRHAARVSVAAGVRDVGYGVDSVAVALLDPSTRAVLTRASLRAIAGSWIGSLHVPTWAGAGTRAFRLRVTAIDRWGNATTLSSRQLAARRLPSTIVVTSRGDSHAPRLTSVTFPAAVDTRGADVRVPVSVRVVDDVSGARAPRLLLQATDLQDSASFVLTSTTGTLRDRTFHGYVTIPRCTQPGRWYPQVTLVDNARNSRLTKPRVSIRVTALDDKLPTWYPRTAGRTVKRVLLTMSEPVILDKAPESAFTLKDERNAVVSGTWTCQNTNAVTVDCLSYTAGIAQLVFTPTDQHVAYPTWRISPVPDFPSIGVYDLAGNPVLPVSWDIAPGRA